MVLALLNAFVGISVEGEAHALFLPGGMGRGIAGSASSPAAVPPKTTAYGSPAQCREAISFRPAIRREYFQAHGHRAACCSFVSSTL